MAVDTWSGGRDPSGGHPRTPGPSGGHPRTPGRDRDGSRGAVLRVKSLAPSPTEPVLLALVVGVLLALGLLMTFSSSFVQSTVDSGSPYGIFLRQLLWSALGVPLLVGAARTDHRRLGRLAALLFGFAALASAVVLVPGVGVVVNGARRWIDLGPLRFQPAELLKLALPLHLAALLSRRWDRIRAGDLRALLLPAVPLIALSAALVLAEPDLETAILIAATGGIVLWAAGLPGRIIGVGGSLALLVAAAAVVSTPFRRARFAAWLEPTAYADTFGYQTVQGFIALGSGGWNGVGLGSSRGTWLYIPNAHTDFVFAIIGEELGFIGATAVLLLFAALAVLGIRAARHAPDVFGRLAAAGITGWLLLQAGINIGSVVGLLPVTGVTLPLVSFGGSSLVFTMGGLGILLSISRAGTDALPGAREALDLEDEEPPLRTRRR